MWGEWNIFTLTVKRKVAGEPPLAGIITNEAWYGPKTEMVRGPCEGRLAYLVSMDAEGAVVDGKIQFGGVGQWRLDESYCGGTDFGYNLDQFEGTIDPELLEFQSVNNDGGRYVNVATVFSPGRVPRLGHARRRAEDRPDPTPLLSAHGSVRRLRLRALNLFRDPSRGLDRIR